MGLTFLSTSKNVRAPGEGNLLNISKSKKVAKKKPIRKSIPPPLRGNYTPGRTKRGEGITTQEGASQK